MSRRDVWKFNLFPAYRGTGGRLVYIADDWSEVRIRLRLTWRTRNYVGTLFGGSLYGAVDPLYMVMLMHRLGPEYVVWDKSASIRFRRPGRGTLYATFRIDDDELAASVPPWRPRARSTASTSWSSWTPRASRTRPSRRRSTSPRSSRSYPSCA